MDRRLQGLDGLRGILALAVAYSHSFGHLVGWKLSYGPIKNGAFAVDVFFIMSGIVLYHAYRDRFAASDRPIKSFFLARFWRLWPVHIFSIVLIFLVFLVTRGILLPGWIRFNSPAGFFLDASLLSSVGLFGDQGMVNHPSWSISVEMWYGFLIMLVLFREWRWAFPMTVAAGIVVMIGTFREDGGASPIFLGISSGAWRCVFGMALGVIAYKTAEAFYSRLPSCCIEFMAGLCAVTIFAVLVGLKPTDAQFLALTACVSFLVMAVPFSSGWVMQLFEAAPVKRLGELSFSLYLIHTPVIYALLIFKSDSRLPNIVLAHVAIVLSVVASKYCNQFVENRFAYRWKTSEHKGADSKPKTVPSL